MLRRCAVLIDTKKIKKVKHPGYNYIFEKDSGFFARWGATLKDDPQLSPVGPEIVDIEVSTICNGPFGKRCFMCYKNGTAHNENMNLETFKKVLDKLTETNNLTQVAFGIGDMDSNPDLVPMFRYCRENDIVPNLTVNGARLDVQYENKTYAQHIADLCGAVAVSHYDDSLCFDAVKKFTDLGMTQVNIHKVLAEETIVDCFRLLKLKESEYRLAKLNAIVFLLYKPKSGNAMTPLKDMFKYQELIEYALNNNISIGFDSCGANKFIDVISENKDFAHLTALAEPCESGLFSVYVNVHGDFYPCSFSEGVSNWTTGISVVECDNFLEDVWFHPRTIKWRDGLLANNRSCPIYNI